MTKITFIEHTGERHSVDANTEESLMQAAVDNDVPGIDADCGGSCACGTCHVIVSEKWIRKVGPISDAEQSMLELTPDFQPGSRLACQVKIQADLDGLEVQLPEFQM